MCFPAPVFFCSNEMKTLKGKSSARWSSTLCVCGGVPHDFLLAFFFEQKQEPVGGGFILEIRRVLTIVLKRSTPDKSFQAYVSNCAKELKYKSL